MTKNIVSIRIAGPAGTGVKSTGKILQKAFRDLGLYTFGYPGYPSLIRGGQNFYQVNVSKKPVNASLEKVDILIPLNFDAFLTYKYTLANNALVLGDSNLLDKEKVEKNLGKGARFIPIPVLKTLRENSIPAISQNVFLVGAILKLLGLKAKKAKKTIEKIFKNKEKKVLDLNVKALELGKKSVSDSVSDRFDRIVKISKKKRAEKSFLKENIDKKSLIEEGTGTKLLIKAGIDKKLLIISGNEAIALGFIAGGGTFYSAYPMTPSTNILHFLAKHGEKHGIIVRQASTEIEAVGVAAGASFAGARPMVATSGGGLDLMGEFISMLGITEIPLVIIDAQRTGPGTGLPTWTEQSDLNLAKNIGHGEFPRIVLAPGDPLEAYQLTIKALSLTEKWQVPVILLSDKYLSESFYSVYEKDITQIKIPIDRGKITNSPKKNFRRYKFSLDGVSPRTLPGTKNGLYIANSDEHDTYGNSIESDPTRVLMQGKRLLKLEEIKKEMPLPKLYGPKKAQNLIVVWGSMKWPGIYYAKNKNQNIKKQENQYKVAHFSFMYPLDKQRLKEFFKPYKKIIVMENNSTGQFAETLEGIGIKIYEKVLKFDGEPFFIGEK